jgi:hypothetical protein
VVRPRKPGSRQSVRFVGVDHRVLSLSQQAAQAASGMESGQPGADFVDGDTMSASALGQRRASGGDELRLVAAGTQATQQDEPLVLPAAPLRIEVNKQGSHGRGSVGRGMGRGPLEILPSRKYFRKT